VTGRQNSRNTLPGAGACKGDGAARRRWTV